MVTNLCFGLTCLLIPVLIELFNLQAGFHTTNMGHALIEVLILCGIYWLFMQILRLDEWLYLRNYFQERPISKPERRSARDESLVQPISHALAAERTHIKQPKAAAFHWLRLPFENVLKNHRTVKP